MRAEGSIPVGQLGEKDGLQEVGFWGWHSYLSFYQKQFGLIISHASEDGVSETKVQYLLQSANNGATIDSKPRETVEVDRAELEKEHSLLIARVHQLRRILGYPPLMTGKESDRLARK